MDNIPILKDEDKKLLEQMIKGLEGKFAFRIMEKTTRTAIIKRLELKKCDLYLSRLNQIGEDKEIMFGIKVIGDLIVDLDEMFDKYEKDKKILDKKINIDKKNSNEL